MNDAELMSALFVGVIAAFYFMFWRPDQKVREKQKKQLRDLRPGDQVLTTSNFVAKVKEIQVQEHGQTRILLELADGVVVTAVAGAILERIQPANAPQPSDPSKHEGAHI